MKERPILFSSEMVRAILKGKDQTRRPINKLKGYRYITEFKKSETPGYDFTFRRPDMVWCDYRRQELLDLCPYGKPGDRLYVRETFTEKEGQKIYKADGSNKDLGVWWGWTPSIHMPRGASRLTLEITELRAEPLQDISEEDAIAEGIDELICPQCGCGDYLSHGATIKTRCSSQGCGLDYLSAVEGYRNLWESLNGNKHPWAANDWVFVLGLKRVEL